MKIKAKIRELFWDIVQHIAELAIGLFIALYVYDETHPAQQYPDYSREAERAVVELRNISKAIYHLEQTYEATDSLKRADAKTWQNKQAELDKRRFGHYLNN